MKDTARRQRILKKAEEDLRRAIAQDLSNEKALAAAEEVREAKLSLFKGQREIARYIENPSESERNHLARLEDREREWETKKADDIIAEYG